MNPLKFISDYMEKAKSQIYGILIFWIFILHLPVIFTSLFVDQELIYKKTDMLKNEYIGNKFFNFNHWEAWVWEIGSLLVAITLTYLMIWILPKTIVARAYDRELEDHINRERKKLEKEKDLEKERQSVAKKQLKTVEKQEDVAKKQDEVEGAEKQQWDKEYARFSKSKLVNTLPLIAESIYKFKGHIDRFYDDDQELWKKPNIKDADVAIAHSNGLIDLDSKANTISLTEKGKYFLNQSYYDTLP